MPHECYGSIVVIAITDPYNLFLMNRIITGIVGVLFCLCQATGQEACYTSNYLQNIWQGSPEAARQAEAVKLFVDRQIAARQADLSWRGDGTAVITVPVVVHILYNTPNQNISDDRIYSQLKVLNDAFRRMAADTVNTPDRFKDRAADAEIEFRLATSDPNRRATTGIIHQYTPISLWEPDDKMKYSAQMGADAWDTDSYLNIWVCPLRRQLGYASFPGGDPVLDGIVLNTAVVGVTGKGDYNQGKTAVHEAGHWLGLRHIWGDDYCGDDGVDDTPQQANFTNGCPTGVRVSCGNSKDGGDMYMNYMDITTDPCTNLFTEGQKQRMRALFDPGGARYGLLRSGALNPPLYQEIPVAEDAPTWLHPQLYPNPATAGVTLDLAYDPRWVGATLVVTNLQGVVVKKAVISNKIQALDIRTLKPGLYLLNARRADGVSLKFKLVKI